MQQQPLVGPPTRLNQPDTLQTNVLTFLPDDLKEKLIETQEKRTKIQCLYESVHTISTLDALIFFRDDITRKKAMEQRELVKKSSDVARMNKDDSSCCSNLEIYVGELQSLLHSPTIKLHLAVKLKVDFTLLLYLSIERSGATLHSLHPLRNNGQEIWFSRVEFSLFLQFLDGFPFSDCPLPVVAEWKVSAAPDSLQTSTSVSSTSLVSSLVELISYVPGLLGASKSMAVHLQPEEIYPPGDLLKLQLKCVPRNHFHHLQEIYQFHYSPEFSLWLLLVPRLIPLLKLKCSRHLSDLSQLLYLSPLFLVPQMQKAAHKLSPLPLESLSLHCISIEAVSSAESSRSTSSARISSVHLLTGSSDMMISESSLQSSFSISAVNSTLVQNLSSCLFKSSASASISEVEGWPSSQSMLVASKMLSSSSILAWDSLSMSLLFASSSEKVDEQPVSPSFSSSMTKPTATSISAALVCHQKNPTVHEFLLFRRQMARLCVGIKSPNLYSSGPSTSASLPSRSPSAEAQACGQTFLTDVPSASVPPGLSMRYAGNFESFRVEEQVAFCVPTSAKRATLERFFAVPLAGLKVGVLTSFKLDVFDKVLAGLSPEAGLNFELPESSILAILTLTRTWFQATQQLLRFKMISLNTKLGSFGRTNLNTAEMLTFTHLYSGSLRLGIFSIELSPRVVEIPRRALDLFIKLTTGKPPRSGWGGRALQETSMVGKIGIHGGVCFCGPFSSISNEKSMVSLRKNKNI
ncbi:hypothetical protein SADUNF_Sadunf03G0154900 [Salix dunnii]|uniref:Uncharacterized protein n=1 Tax=Salix dunnii TaxID=1413687 RepID=A0A835TGW4_9ROSI|nr:hypothetical protein SADUNF_Sadunf03G0154900 [Salix dunnii]